MHETAGSPPGKHHPRKIRSYGLWTADCVEGCTRLLFKYLPQGFATFRFPEQPERSCLKRTLALLTKAIRNFCRYRRYIGHVIVLLENAPGNQFHFHVAFSRAPSGDVLTALLEFWLKFTKQDNNARKVFHYGQKGDDGPAMAAYLSKTQKGNFFVKAEATEWQPELRFKPFRHLSFRVRKTRFSLEPECLNPPSPVSALGTGSTCLKPPSMQRRGETRQALPVLDSRGISTGVSLSHVYLEKGGEHDARSTGCDVVPGVRVGVRISPLFGPGDTLILPDRREAISHATSLGTRWKMEKDSIRFPGPAFHPETVDMVFLIPAGKVREFEIEAKVGFARIFRPDEARAGN